MSEENTESLEAPAIEETQDNQQEVDEPPVKEEKDDYGGRAKKRIDSLLRREREALARAAALEIELERAKSVPAQKQNQGEPNPDDYPAGQYDGKYLRDLTTYIARQQAHELLQSQQKDVMVQQRNNHINQLEKDFVKSTPDYNDILENYSLNPLTELKEFNEVINQADNPAQIKYYLGQHPEEIDKLGEMTALQAIRYIGRLENKIESSKTLESEQKKVSNAPAPVVPLGTGKSTAVIKNPDQMTMEEYAQYRQRLRK